MRSVTELQSFEMFRIILRNLFHIFQIFCKCIHVVHLHLFYTFKRILCLVDSELPLPISRKGTLIVPMDFRTSLILRITIR